MFINTLCLQCRYRHRNLSVIVPVSPYKILYSYINLYINLPALYTLRYQYLTALEVPVVLKYFVYYLLVVSRSQTLSQGKGGGGKGRERVW